MCSMTKVDFVGLLHQQGLDHLNQQIMLMLIPAEHEECNLAEAKLVSLMWKEAVNSLVLEAGVGKTIYIRMLKDMMRRAVSKLEEITPSEEGPTCGCLRRSVSVLKALEGTEGLALAPIKRRITHYLDPLLMEIARENCIHECNFKFQESECQAKWIGDAHLLLASITGTLFQSLSVPWKEKLLKQPISEPSDYWTRALRAILLYRLYWVPYEPVTQSSHDWYT